MRRITLCLLLAVAAAFALPAAPASSSDLGAMREAVERGEIRPLSAVLPAVRAQVPGRVIDATVRRSGRGWHYVIKMLTPDSRVVLVTADARTGSVLSVSGGGSRRRGGRP